MSCTYYRWSGGSFFGDYWCDIKDQRVDSNTYSKYCRDYNYSSCPIYKKNSGSSSTSPCFITTIVCNILGKRDDDKVLNNLRYFREEVLKQDEKYFEILMDYDVIGPVIACNIAHDKDKKTLATGLYDNVLSRVSKNIEEKEYEKAINNYTVMVLSLISYYHLKKKYNNERDNNYDLAQIDITKAGHGKVRKKSN